MVWCLGRESNPHVHKGHRILSPVRLPIPPPKHEEKISTTGAVNVQSYDLQIIEDNCKNDKSANNCNTIGGKLKFSKLTNGTICVDFVDCFGRGFNYRGNFYIRICIILVWHRRICGGVCWLDWGSDSTLQFLVFAVVSIVLTIMSRTIFSKYFSQSDENTLKMGMDTLPGQIGTVTIDQQRRVKGRRGESLRFNVDGFSG